MRLLIVEDEQDLADTLAFGLRRAGYAVDVAYDGAEGLEKAQLHPYDLLCLDLNLPSLDGLELCRRLRAEPRWDGASPPRILMLTARDTLADRVTGLDDGADDYLVKPFDFAELTARVRALLRRDAGGSGAIVRVGSLELDEARHRAWRNGAELPLTAKELALLRYFLMHPGHVLSETRLLTHVWDENASPYTNTVRVTVMTLRKKLDAAGGSPPIETVVGAGYRLREDA